MLFTFLRAVPLSVNGLLCCVVWRNSWCALFHNECSFFRTEETEWKFWPCDWLAVLIDPSITKCLSNVTSTNDYVLQWSRSELFSLEKNVQRVKLSHHIISVSSFNVPISNHRGTIRILTTKSVMVLPEGSNVNQFGWKKLYKKKVTLFREIRPKRIQHNIFWLFISIRLVFSPVHRWYRCLFLENKAVTPTPLLSMLNGFWRFQRKPLKLGSIQSLCVTASRTSWTLHSLRGSTTSAASTDLIFPVSAAIYEFNHRSIGEAKNTKQSNTHCWVNTYRWCE